METAKAPVHRALLLSVILLGVAACANADTTHKHFDVPDQPAVAGLNEFARQADITLFFSYDLVANVHTHPLKGLYTVPEGLNRLLADTGLDHRQASDGTYLICPKSSCGPPQVWPKDSGEAGTPAVIGRSGGKLQQPRLSAMPASAPEI